MNANPNSMHQTAQRGSISSTLLILFSLHIKACVINSQQHDNHYTLASRVDSGRQLQQ